MKDKLKFIILFIAIVGIILMYVANREGVTVKELVYLEDPVLRVGGIALHVEVANSGPERIQGLSGRESLKPLDGLLFVFEENGYHGIWMKDMKFPIDVIWISEELEVVGITEGLLPESYPTVYEPPRPVKYVLETARYFSETYGITEGDRVEIPLKLLE